MADQFDLIVIGTGGGLKLAFPAADKGLRVAIIEDGPVGGTCLNRGCIPSKMLIHPAEVASIVRHAPRLGLEISTAASIDLPRLVKRISSEIGAISDHLRSRCERDPKIELIRGHGRFVAEKVLEVNGRRIEAERIVIAAGSRPRVPDLPGLAGSPFMTSEEALTNTTLPRSMLVVGGGYIALELGCAYASFGVGVQFVVRSSILRGEDDEIVGEFQRVLKEDHVLHKGLNPVSVEWDGRGFTLLGRYADGREEHVRAEALLMATGVKPNTDDLGLEHTAVKLSDDGTIAVDDCLRTTAPGIYALGDVVGNYYYRHTANFEGEYLARHVLDGLPWKPIDYGPVPRAVFAQPQIAAVGQTEQELADAGVDYIVGRATYADSNQGLARLSSAGLVKLLAARDTGALLGACIVGEEASDMIHLFIVAMLKRATLDDLMGMIFIHPALPEIARDAVRDAAARRG